jgi:hypothetical protein
MTDNKNYQGEIMDYNKCFIQAAAGINLSRILRNYSGGRCASLSARNNSSIWVWYPESHSFFLRRVLTIALVKGVCL